MKHRSGCFGCVHVFRWERVSADQVLTQWMESYLWPLRPDSGVYATCVLHTSTTPLEFSLKPRLIAVFLRSNSMIRTREQLRRRSTIRLWGSRDRETAPHCRSLPVNYWSWGLWKKQTQGRECSIASRPPGNCLIYTRYSMCDASQVAGDNY